MEKIKLEKDQIKEIVFACYPFVCVFLAMSVFLINRGTMCDDSGDAAEIWKTIKTYGTNNMYASYVLYKGVQAVYPYVWLYRMAVFFGTNEWLFVMLFYGLVFSYITTIGFPHLVEMFFKINTVHYRKLILGLVCFYFWEKTLALSQLMVDLPGLMYFLLLVNAALKIYRYGVRGKYLFWCSIWLGMNLGGSGQYTAPAYCIIIFLGIVLIKKYSKKRDKNIIKTFKCIAILVFPAVLMKIYNDYFLEAIVGGLRQAGAWIPSNGDWLKIGLSRFMNMYRAKAELGTVIPSNLNQAIFQAHLGDDIFEQMQSTILAGGYELSVAEYLQLFIKYPLNFALCYLEKFFLILSPDRGSFSFLPLFIFWTMLFIAIKIVITDHKRMISIINVKFWIVFSFLWAVVPALVMVPEMRTVMQIQGFILATALCRNELWNKLSEVFSGIRNWKIRNMRDIREKEIPYTFLCYCCFIVVCFLHISSLYELIGVDANSIMLKFW